MTVKAIYQNGVFKPIEPVNLPEQSEVQVVLPTPADDDTRLDAIYRIMGETYASGHINTAQRHNEHQP